ncbi:MAG TPA: carboxy terminal-processing peptidase [Candidatus Paceibacterota bacterium]|nr:carboxy terminal-processing peptidase [Verrucomicrobiota bacterium]HRY48776.1 carboxy terminal-processing peptidase [Candidatus Paceibacterota bacterium]HRZ99824.1 carboxy terminal-processing peptidase [Candidatus Paceibacterota bacterium]
MKNLIRTGVVLAGWMISLVVMADRTGPAEGALSADRAEAAIARLTALVLENSVYQGGRFDDDMSEKFFDQYFKSLDPSRMIFLKGDLEEFASYRLTLDDLILKVGDTSPAHRIFARYLERLSQRAEYARELLAKEKFEFADPSIYSMDREKASRPADIEEARQLWRQHLRYEYLQEKLSKKKPEEIVDTLKRRYERSLQTMKKFDRDQVFEIFLTSLAHVFDPHSDYMGRRQMQDFSIHMKLSLFGIGATLRSEDGYCKVLDLVPGGPAALSGLIKVGDRIVAVAQEGKEEVDIIDMPLPQAVEMIRGTKGTTVHLTIIPADAVDSSVRKKISLVRAEVSLKDQEARAILTTVPVGGVHRRVGIIDLPSFYADLDRAREDGHKSATADVSKLIEKLKKEKVEGIVLDLRRNGGGSLEEAVGVTGLFIHKGPVVQTKNSNGQVRVETDTDPAIQYEGPLVVLTSRLSASASEILAGALQDYQRALIVGEQSTFGKGTVQSVLSLAPMMAQAGLPVQEDPGALKLTIRKFYLPAGSSTQLKGVVPDIHLPSLNNVAKIGESELDNPMPHDKIEPVPFKPLNRIKPFLPVLSEKSAKRVAAEQEYRWLIEDIAELKKKIENPVVSLNEEQRIQEKEEAERRVEARKKARASRPSNTQTNWEITLALADMAGLPEPTSNLATNRHDLRYLARNEDPEDAGKEPLVDIALEETKSILADYLAQMAQQVDSTADAGKDPARPGNDPSRKPPRDLVSEPDRKL